MENASVLAGTLTAQAAGDGRGYPEVEAVGPANIRCCAPLPAERGGRARGLGAVCRWLRRSSTVALTLPDQPPGPA